MAGKRIASQEDSSIGLECRIGPEHGAPNAEETARERAVTCSGGIEAPLGNHGLPLAKAHACARSDDNNLAVALQCDAVA